jgi:SAM-dependent methyltransferase
LFYIVQNKLQNEHKTMSKQQDLAKNIINIYQKHGRDWTHLRGEFLYEQAWLDAFLAVMPQSSKILDLGCGSGKPIAQYFIKQNYQLTGVDSSEQMLEMAEQSFPEQRWILQDMRKLALHETFAGILAWDSFFHLAPDDQRAMFQIFQNHADKDAALLFSSGPAAGEAIGELFGEALYHASLSAEEYTRLLNQHGFEVVKMIAEDPNCAGHTVWLARKI